MREALSISYRHPVVRDLAWVMCSPGLLYRAPAGQDIVTDDRCRQIYMASTQQLRALDENPSPLLQALSQNKSHRLGVYFEFLLRYWLEEILLVQQLRHNVPVFEEGQSKGRRTLGEFDFLFRLAGKKPWQHWEATVKFYLLRRNDKGEAYWLGPGGRDRLDIKLDRLFQHQLKLASLAQAQAVVAENAQASVESAAFIKGYLFYPLDEHGELKPIRENAPDLEPYALSKDHLQGWWLRWQQASLPQSADESCWVVLSKHRWLSPVCLPDEAEVMKPQALATWIEGHFRQNTSPLLLVELRAGAGTWEEVSRGFVLSPA